MQLVTTILDLTVLDFRTIRQELKIAILSMFKEKAMAPHSGSLPWKNPWTEGPRGLQSMGSLGVGDD